MDSVIKKLKLEGKTKDFTWFKEKFDAGILEINGEALSENVFEQFRLAIKCVKEIYDDNWDVDIIMNDSRIDILGIVIHFPNFIIKNSKNKSHNIKDLFVRIPFVIGDNRLKVEKIQGGRISVTYAEYCSAYHHSHLNSSQMNSSRDAPYYTNFCTGSGSINVYSMSINSDGFSELLFTQYLLAIVTLVNWESLEGSPYRHLEQIRERSDSNLYNYSLSYALNFFRLFIGYLRTNSKAALDIDIYIEPDGYKIRQNEKFEKFLMQVPLSDSQKKEFLCFIASSGQAYKYSVSLNTRYDIPDLNTPRGEYIFNQKEFQANIIIKEVSKEEEETAKFSLHPEILTYLKKELEYELNKTTIRQSTINRYQHQIDNAREGITSDQAPVQEHS